ncbi:unnamed protein product [Ambrosiozyma monospora]|uniref:Unnamed protein product n=1 Tax=Ambrosiozyma monospora TaxID=43982 RepID=A0A9W6Z252_AMBMO|nr:unnamed protein product [Ambrosiozyma monospora]
MSLNVEISDAQFRDNHVKKLKFHSPFFFDSKLSNSPSFDSILSDQSSQIIKDDTNPFEKSGLGPDGLDADGPPSPYLPPYSP